MARKIQSGNSREEGRKAKKSVCVYNEATKGFSIHLIELKTKKR